MKNTIIMTLHDISFDKDEVETYTRLLLEGRYTETQRLLMLKTGKTCGIL